MHPLRFIRTMLILLTGFLFASAQVNSQDQKPLPTQIAQRDAILVGTAWYPEQWPESRWEEDLRLMEAANIKVVRMAEFSWSLQKGTTTWIGSIGQSPRFAGKMGLDLMMLSITLVPVHDGREALAEYGRVWKIDASGWRLLSGPPAEIQKFCARFGVSFFPDEGQLIHSLHTLVVESAGEPRDVP